MTSQTAALFGRGRIRSVAALASVTCLISVAAIAPTPAQAKSKQEPKSPVTVVTKKLNGPRQLSAAYGGLLVVQSETGKITAVNRHTGQKFTVVRKLANPQGAVARGGRVYIATGETEPDAAPSGKPTSGLMVAEPGGKAKMFADLTAYELKHNPDGQRQFGKNGQPLDALSNPYFVLKDRTKKGFLLVADAGGNDVLKVDRHGKVSTFFVPPTVTTGPCATLPNNNKSGVGCDAVPTGLAYGPGGLLYISALTSEAPGQGRVYVVDRFGHRVRTIKGFSSPTGVAVGDHGTVYVSELLEGAPEGQPSPDFDPSTVGQIVKVPRHGARSYAQVTMPSGLLYAHSKLYASTWAIASFLGMEKAGQVAIVKEKAFTAKK